MSVDKYALNNLIFKSSNNLGKARCEPGWSWQRTRLADYDLWYVVNGSGIVTINERQYPAHKGHCFLIRPGDWAEAIQHPDDRILVIYIHFTIEGKSNYPMNIEECMPKVDTRIEDTYRFELDLHRLLEIQEQQGLNTLAQFDILMKLVWLHLLQHRHHIQTGESLSFKNKQKVLQASDYIRLHVGEPLSHETIAKRVELSPRYLSRIFKEQTGYSLKEYITRQRIERAKVLLTETPMNVTQVAEAVGYDDIYFFSKLFKRLHGFPPTYFQRIAHLHRK